MSKSSQNDADVEQVVRRAEEIELAGKEALWDLKQVEHTPCRVEHEHEKITPTRDELIRVDTLNKCRVRERYDGETNNRAESDCVSTGRLEELEAPTAVRE